VSIGFQAGGQGYSQIIFLEDKRAFEDLTSGNFEFGANATASGGKKDAATIGGFHNGTAVFIITKGGLMYEASVSGQKFSYTPLGKK
jgi:lipid-binding SYLF domain-containing protein